MQQEVTMPRIEQAQADEAVTVEVRVDPVPGRPVVDLRRLRRVMGREGYVEEVEAVVVGRGRGAHHGGPEEVNPLLVGPHGDGLRQVLLQELPLLHDLRQGLGRDGLGRGAEMVVRVVGDHVEAREGLDLLDLLDLRGRPAGFGGGRDAGGGGGGSAPPVS